MKTRISAFAGPLGLFVLALGLVIPARVARAGDGGNSVEIYPSVKVPDPKDPKTKGAAPQIEVTIVGGPKVPLDKFSISTTNKNQKVTVKAEKLREYSEGTETIAIALVVCGQMIWIGNDDYEPDETAKYQGVLKNLEQAIDKLQLGNAGPPGSKGVVISYSTGAEIKIPMGDLKNITGGALGGQRDYAGKIGADLVQGITSGIAELSKVSTARKALIVIGDGNDTNNETAKGSLNDLRKQAQKQNIQLFGIIYKSAVSSEGAVITTMIPTARAVNSIDGIQSELSAIIARMGERYYLTFPGWDPKIENGLPWDGKDHDLTIKIDQQELEPFSLTLAPVWNPPSKGGFPWLILVGVLVGLILLIVIGVKVFGAKPAPAPMPVPMPMAAAPAPPKPAGPMKTVMIGVGGDQEGFPIVGWLVALNGVNAYQTYRLKPGMTKIGTAPPSDMVVNDGFMSTEHCQIACAPGGFTLIDNGSTNGSYVNDRKVSKHELVDNDTVTLGKTNFKFKSIN
ncbi:MAG: domain containing protein [Myxococcales bacterium]|nr:domain containing protein [Myxococcales bacterium]